MALEAGIGHNSKNILKGTVNDTPRILLRSDICKSAGALMFDGEIQPVYVVEEDFEAAYKSVTNPSQLIMLPKGYDPSAFYGPDAKHGLLYLPYPYLVPGGRFNEMYGWDSAFPVLAWTKSHPKLMREQVDNQLYQIKVYGKVLNANRTYFLSRSQPPLLSMMVWQIWREAQLRPWTDFDPDGIYTNASYWLRFAYTELVKLHAYWTSRDRMAGDTGLSRYWDEGEVAAPEVVSSERGHFHHAIEHFKSHTTSPDDIEDAKLFYDSTTETLTPLYHRANRAMRASGFDPTGHWDYGALRCMFHATGCLNSLLYRMEKELADMATLLDLPTESTQWIELSKERKARMKKYMFDTDTGIYFDYDFERKRLNKKPFATMFLPFWAGLYDAEEDKEDIEKAFAFILKNLETPYGIVTSLENSGSQWDYPNGWPPLQYFAFNSLARYGFMDDAKRIAQKYLELTSSVMQTNGTFYEKYNMIEGNAEVHVVNGYDINVSERGTFLWTAATAEMADELLRS